MLDYTKIFHTVPLGGTEMYRGADGKKYGQVFPKDGWTSFITKRNTDNTPLLAAIALKDFIGLDFDTDESFNIALQIDPECAYIAKSDHKGGHLLYRWTEDLEETSSIFKSSKKVKGILDLQVGNTLIFLATPANKTKTLLTDPLKSLDSLTSMPIGMQLYVENIILKYQNANIIYDTPKTFNINEESTLGYVLEKVQPTDGYNIDIFKLLTPKKYKPNCLHPNDIPDGEGTDYLQSIRTRLALDPSISEVVFKNVMHYVNNQWDDPMPPSRIESDCDYQTTKATIDGNKAWVYDPEWTKKGLIVKDKFLSAIEYFFDSSSSKFLEFNRTTKDIIIHSTTSNAKNSYVSKKKSQISVNEMISKAIDIDIANDPTRPSYLLESKAPYKPVFNMFVPAMGTMILRDPGLVSNPRYPKHIMDFLHNLIPNKNRLSWLLKFIRYKHLTYEYSPIYLVFAGVGGAGKGVFVSLLLKYFAGLERIQDIDLDKLQNNFNAWKAATDYAHLDEAGEGFSKREAALIVAELKKLTGSPTASITYKGKDVSGKDNMRHFITPILNTNINVKVITDLPKNDRRFVFIKCPNKMAKVSDNNDSLMVSLMKEELPHFAHYLATQVEEIDARAYNSNDSQKDEDYYEFMRATMDPMHLLVEAAEEANIDKFINVLQEEFFVSNANITKLFDPKINADEGRILLYNTPATSTMHCFSLYDLAMESEQLDGSQVKKLLTHLKKASTYKADSGAVSKYSYIGFSSRYVSFDAKQALDASIEDVDL